jgi:predicted  nucleic acid-binding Zn-ribbon protein
MSSVIKSKSLEESKAATARQEAEMKKYLKYLEKMRAKSITNECSRESLEERVSQLEREAQEGREREEKLQSESLIDKKRLGRYSKWMAVSLLLNLLMIMIIVTLL